MRTIVWSFNPAVTGLNRRSLTPEFGKGISGKRLLVTALKSAVGTTQLGNRAFHRVPAGWVTPLLSCSGNGETLVLLIVQVPEPGVCRSPLRWACVKDFVVPPA